MSVYDFIDFIGYLCVAAILLPIGFGSNYWRELSDREQKLVLFLVALLLLEIISIILRFNLVRNHFLYYFKTWSVLWISAVYFRSIDKLRRWSTIIAGLLAVSVLVEVYVWVGFNHINTITRTLAWLLLSLCGFAGLIQLLNQPSEKSLRQQPAFYYYSGFFTIGFFSANTSLFSNYFIETSLDLYYFFDTLKGIMSAVGYGVFTWGFFQHSRLFRSQKAL
ncbi:MAG: hypothetical protein EAZ91_21600 [Cytophagales bacterium]|nr:MAG: hypothetical protein EAZ91_21600 [Cytophagales bacterium]